MSTQTTTPSAVPDRTWNPRDLSRYAHYGDRSPEARAANAAYMRSYRLRKRAEREAGAA